MKAALRAGKGAFGGNGRASRGNGALRAKEITQILEFYRPKGVAAEQSEAASPRER